MRHEKKVNTQATYAIDIKYIDIYVKSNGCRVLRIFSNNQNDTVIKVGTLLCGMPANSI